jgi:hypothetical protein
MGDATELSDVIKAMRESRKFRTCHIIGQLDHREG